MALGDRVNNPQLTTQHQASISYACLVDATQITGGPTAIAQGQTSYFALICPTCQTRYLIAVAQPSPTCTVTQTG